MILTIINTEYVVISSYHFTVQCTIVQWGGNKLSTTIASKVTSYFNGPLLVDILITISN